MCASPDFATVTVRYVPDESIVELKSLKLYLWSYRDEGAFHEDVTNRILDRLTDVHRRAERICADLTAVLPRFGRYGVRLGNALARADAGETAAVADTIDSYHSVWFQLHEDLLVTLGLPRWA